MRKSVKKRFVEFFKEDQVGLIGKSKKKRAKKSRKHKKR